MLFAAALALTACTNRTEFDVVPNALDFGTGVELFVAAARGTDETGTYPEGRGTDVTHGRYTVSVPPDRALGTLPTPYSEPADPRHHFIVAEAENLDDPAAFRNGLSRALDTQPGKEAIIFVHGFNNSFADGLYRQAQMVHDLNLPGVPVYFSWPSAANPMGYSYDRDSALFARTPFETLIRDVEAAGAENIVIVAHSMGALLTMETLRQMALRDGGTPSVELGGVVLIAPDVDVELFRRLADEIGTLPQPFAIFVSQNDRTLLLSAMLTGETDRLGNIHDPARIGDLPVTIVDVTEFSSTAENKHLTAVTSPLLIQILGQVTALDTSFDADRSGRPGLLPGTAIGLQRATQVVLSPGLTLN